MLAWTRSLLSRLVARNLCCWRQHDFTAGKKQLHPVRAHKAELLQKLVPFLGRDYKESFRHAAAKEGLQEYRAQLSRAQMLQGESVAAMQKDYPYMSPASRSLTLAGTETQHASGIEAGTRAIPHCMSHCCLLGSQAVL